MAGCPSRCCTTASWSTSRANAVSSPGRVEMRVSQAHVTATVLDSGELACRHRRSFAGGLTFTDPAHQTELERLRARRRQRDQVEVEIRPLARYDAVIPA